MSMVLKLIELNSSSTADVTVGIQETLMFVEYDTTIKVFFQQAELATLIKRRLNILSLNHVQCRQCTFKAFLIGLSRLTLFSISLYLTIGLLST